MSKKKSMRQQRPRPRLKGIAKAMAQAGVEWDPKVGAQRHRQSGHATARRPVQFGPRSERPLATPATPQADLLPLSALAAMLVVGLVGYFVAEFSLGSFPHPLHWLATAVVALLGYAGGLVWHRIRGV